MSADDTEHQHTPDEERQIRDAALDQTIEGSFHASDPPSSNPNPDDHAALERLLPKEEQTNTASPDQTKGRQYRGTRSSWPSQFRSLFSRNTKLLCRGWSRL